MDFSLPNRLAQGAIRLYQVSLSPLMPSRCRFSPSCSSYAHEAFAKYSFVKALRKSIWRFLRCHPFSRGGVDQP